MLVNQKAKHHKKLHPTRIYLDNCSTYNQMYNEELLTDVIEGKNLYLEVAIQGPLPPTRSKVLVPLSVLSTRKVLLISSAS